jgi:hypothetical protein
MYGFQWSLGMNMQTTAQLSQLIITLHRKSKPQRMLHLILASSLVSCDTDDSRWQGRQVTENGHQVIYNPATPLLPDVNLSLNDRVRSFGTGDLETDGLIRPVNRSVNHQEEVAMLDNGRFQVVMYGPDGKYLRSYGKPGNGPGELAASFGLRMMTSKSLSPSTPTIWLLSFRGNEKEQNVSRDRRRS